MSKIRIRKESCKSCLYCVKFCPKDVLAAGENMNSKGYPYVTVVNENNCVKCGICAAMCPDAAIDIF